MGSIWMTHLHFVAPTKGTLVVRHQKITAFPKSPWETL